MKNLKWIPVLLLYAPHHLNRWREREVAPNKWFGDGIQEEETEPSDWWNKIEGCVKKHVIDLIFNHPTFQTNL